MTDCQRSTRPTSVSPRGILRKMNLESIACLSMHHEPSDHGSDRGRDHENDRGSDHESDRGHDRGDKDSVAEFRAHDREHELDQRHRDPSSGVGWMMRQAETLEFADNAPRGPC